ncbi:MAG: hypothetical protein GY780_09065 [bacterium]|nr:hypothetical protein [bacterium]
MLHRIFLGTVLVLIFVSPTAAASPDDCCQIEKGIQAIWSGTNPIMTYEELASYCGPILWFSPDEPSLERAKGADIRVPTSFPFEKSVDAPVVYYMVRNLVQRGDDSGPAIYRDNANRIDTEMDLRSLVGIDLDYFFYYPTEEGLGAHKHDVESVFVKLYVHHCEDCIEDKFALFVERTTAKAHGLQWYDNTLVSDEYTEFPMTILVEEGKHASCTDKNHDGVYTPTFDVNQRVNDAWGLRDIMRSGGLYSGGFQAWMAKVRHPEYRVFPPLPKDSPLREFFEFDGRYAANHAIYQLRPFPRPEEVDQEKEPTLIHFIDDKGDPEWPELMEANSLKAVTHWMDEETFINSLSFAYRYDGLNYGHRNHTGGISMMFPLLIVKNVSDPVAGGWFVNRIYFKDKKLRDFSWNLVYTPSASRWIDGYFAAGWEWDEDDFGNVHTDIMTETGLKFRLNMSHTPLSFLSVLGTDFWGVRIGVKNKGIFNWESMGYAVEIGAGVW